VNRGPASKLVPEQWHLAPLQMRSLVP
jgi:hypothetical protein